MQYKIPTLFVISSQFPEFIRDDYPKFIRFIELYYKFLNEDNIHSVGSRFETIRDIDLTLDKFIDYIWKELGVDIPRNTICDDKHFINHIKDFYSTKGSEESFRILFRHLFNIEIDLKYPKESIFRSSAGNWKQDLSVITQITSGNIDDIIGHCIIIKTKNQDILVTVTKIKDSGKYKEIFFETFQPYLINIGDILIFNDFNATIVGTISTISIYKAGSGFFVGQLLDLPSMSGTSAKVKVTKINSIGGILEIQLINFGVGYEHTFYASIISGSTSNVLVTDAFNDSTGGFIDYGFVSSIPYSDITYCDSSYCGEILQDFYTNSSSEIGTHINDSKVSILNIQIGSIRKYPGFYLDASGFTSDAYCLQDANYYQTYSYVISSIKSIETYSKIVKKLIHPAGLRLFSEQQITNSLSLVDSLEILMLHFQVAAREELYSSDIEVYDMMKHVDELLPLLEVEVYSLQKPLYEIIENTDINASHTNKYILNNNYDYVSPYWDWVYSDFNYTISNIPSEILDLNEDEFLVIDKNIVDYIDMSVYGFYWEETYSDLGYVDSTAIYCDVDYWDSTYSNIFTDVILCKIQKSLIDPVVIIDVPSVHFNKGINVEGYIEIYWDESYSDTSYSRIIVPEERVHLSDFVNSVIITKNIIETLSVIDNPIQSIMTKYISDIVEISHQTYCDPQYTELCFELEISPVISYSNSTYNITLTN